MSCICLLMRLLLRLATCVRSRLSGRCLTFNCWAGRFVWWLRLRSRLRRRDGWTWRRSSPPYSILAMRPGRKTALERLRVKPAEAIGQRFALELEPLRARLHLPAQQVHRPGLAGQEGPCRALRPLDATDAGRPGDTGRALGARGSLGSCRSDRRHRPHRPRRCHASAGRSGHTPNHGQRQRRESCARLRRGR